MQQRRALQDVTNQEPATASLKQTDALTPPLLVPGPEVPSLRLSPAQKVQLQQQMQQVCLHILPLKTRASLTLCLLVSMCSCSPRCTCSAEAGTT